MIMVDGLGLDTLDRDMHRLAVRLGEQDAAEILADFAEPDPARRDHVGPWTEDTTDTTIGKLLLQIGFLRRVGARLMQVFRGATLRPEILERYSVGAVVEEAAFTSTSPSETGAERFAFDPEPPRRSVLFTIESKTGRLIALYLLDPDDADGIDIFEAEVLFLPGCRFKVTDRFEDEYQWIHLHMEEIDDRSSRD